MQTNPQLQLANDFIRYTGQHVFLTGKAGTGKTTFLKELKKHSPKRMVVVAPTGVAAINAGGMTIHSFFQLSFAPQIGEESEQNAQKHITKKKLNIIRSLDLLVIDEISMVRADVLDAIDRTLRRIRKTTKPFGGVQLLMIGDLQQLAPVVKNEEWDLLKTVYDTAFFFSSTALKQSNFVSIELTHIYRQQDEKFISILNKVRDNKLDKATAVELNKRFIPNFTIPEGSDYITLCTHNVQAKKLNDAKMASLKTKQLTLTAEVEGIFPEYSYPTDKELVLKVGAQVMFIKNDTESEKRFFNGKIGKITSLAVDKICVQCPDEDDEIEVTPMTWHNIKYSVDEKTAEIKEEVEGSFKQMPLKTGWAITIHKSQGLTFDRAVIDAHSSFAHGQVYVALSRCRTLEGLVLSSPVDDRSIISDYTIKSFVKGVEENQPNEDQLLACKNTYQAEIINDIFDFSQVLFNLRGVIRVTRENMGAFPDDFLQKIENINVAITQDLANVAVKFKTQVANLLNENADAEANPKLQERIVKGAAYFSEKTKMHLISKVELFNLEIDNKAVAKQINKYLEDLEEILKMKMMLFELCESGFQLSNVLDAKAKMMMKNTVTLPKKKKVETEATIMDIAGHGDLFTALRNYRNVKAEELGRPAFYIYSQKTLLELVKNMPTDLHALKEIKGFGAVKVKQFGTEIVEIISDYCAINRIEFDE